MCVQNLKFMALPVHEIIGGRPIQKIRAVAGYAHASFSSNSLMGFCSDGPCECIGHINLFLRTAIEFWVGVANPKLGEEEVVGGRGRDNNYYCSKERR